MSTEIISTSEGRLGEIADQVGEEHRLCAQSLREGLGHAINAGNLLLEAKALCVHGAWGNWLRDNTGISERTAQLYMRVARGLPLLEAKAQHVADLSLREAVALLAEPLTELDRAREFEKWADGIMGPIRQQLMVLEVALSSARTVEELHAISDIAHDCRNRAAEVQIRAKREAGAFLEQLPDCDRESVMGLLAEPATDQSAKGEEHAAAQSELSGPLLVSRAWHYLGTCDFIELSPTSLRFKRDPTYEEWAKLGRILGIVAQSTTEGR